MPQEILAKFVVLGNPKDTKGNPVPCPRLTYQGRFTERAKRYMEWRDMIQTAFFDSMSHLQGKMTEKPIKDMFWRLAKGQKPLLDYKRAHINLKLYFQNKKGILPHPDCDNVLKGVLDALFLDDNRVSFNVDFEEHCSEGKMEVEVLVKF